MGVFSKLFGDKEREMLLGMIRHNADMIIEDEGKSKNDAEYISICMLLDDLTTRENGHKGQRLVMDILLKEYVQHHNDVITYLAVKSGVIKLKPEAEQQLTERHKKATKCPTESPLHLNYSNVEKFLADARACLNDRDGPEFVAGIRLAFSPISTAVNQNRATVLGYGDTILEYAKVTKDNPEARLEALISLASITKHIPGCGMRFVVAELILAYGSEGKFPKGSFADVMMENVRLTAESLVILEACSKYK